MGLSVRMMPARRFSEAMGKYWFTTATDLFQTFSKSADGTDRGLAIAGLGAKIRLTWGVPQFAGQTEQPIWLAPKAASRTTATAAVVVRCLPMNTSLARVCGVPFRSNRPGGWGRSHRHPAPPA